MAQTGYTPISIYYSATTTNVPTAGNLVAGELAINTADGKLFYKDSSGVVQTIASKGTGSVAGSTTQVIYNNAGAYAGSANMTFNGTTLTLANDASINSLVVGKGIGAVSTNTALGVGVLSTVSAGSTNTGVGYNALSASTITGTDNTAVGSRTLSSVVSGSSNTGVGTSTLYSNTASDNTGFGYNALYANTTGSGNVAVGRSALANNTTGGYNIAIGSFVSGNTSSALQANTTGSFNVAVGDSALSTSTTTYYNTGVGYRAGLANTSQGNTFFGANAGASNTTGAGIVAVGYGALANNTTGNSNTAVGGYDNNNSIPQALSSNTTGSYNIAVGTGALQANTTASNNTAIGYQALYNNVTGGDNVAFGYQAGYNCTYSLNIFIGKSSGASMTSGYYNTYIGGNTSASAGGVNNETVIAYGFTGKGSNTALIQGPAYQTSNSATWSITSDERLKKNIVDNTTGLDAISAIQVRNFEYRTKDEVTELPTTSAIEIKGVQIGAIAQELQSILPECVKEESTGVLSVDTTNLTWYLINAIKELNAKITALENK